MSARQPFNARCGNRECGHVWTAVYLPMEMTLAAQILNAARCPMCGSRDAQGKSAQVFVADNEVSRW